VRSFIIYGFFDVFLKGYVKQQIFKLNSEAVLYYLNQINLERTIYFIGLNSAEWINKPPVKSFTNFKHLYLEQGILLQLFLNSAPLSDKFQSFRFKKVGSSPFSLKEIRNRRGKFRI
jgi:hypothetical protein